MTKQELESLQPGDVVRHVHADSGVGGHTWMVSANYGNRVTLVETCDMTNPYEWEVKCKNSL